MQRVAAYCYALVKHRRRITASILITLALDARLAPCCFQPPYWLPIAETMQAPLTHSLVVVLIKYALCKLCV